MARSINRAQFLRGNFTGRHSPVRPPWALSESEFVDICTRCKQCISACPEKILRKDNAGFPRVDFTKGECTFCGQCVTHCETTALQKQTERPAWQLTATISAACLINQDVICSVCAEQCEVSAIRFVFQAGKVPSPEIKVDTCTGCGACFRPCPANAITFQTTKVQTSIQNQTNLSEVM